MPNQNPNVSHILGIHQGRLDSHDVMLKDIKDNIKGEFDAVNTKLDGIQSSVDRRRGANALGGWLLGLILPAIGFFAGKGTHP